MKLSKKKSLTNSPGFSLAASLLMLGVLSVSVYYALKSFGLNGENGLDLPVEERFLKKDTVKYDERDEMIVKNELSYVKIKLINGNVLHGRIISKNKKLINVLGEEGVTTSVRIDMISGIELIYDQ